MDPLIHFCQFRQKCAKEWLNYRSELRAVGEKQLTAVLLDMSKAFDSFHHCSGSKAMKYPPPLSSPPPRHYCPYPPWLSGKKSMYVSIRFDWAGAMVSVRVYIKITPVMIHLSLTITGLEIKDNMASNNARESQITEIKNGDDIRLCMRKFKT